MFKYSVTQWIFGDENLEASLKRLKRNQYHGVELAGEPDHIDIEKTKRLLEKYNMECSSICGIYSKERDLSSSNTNVRISAINYVKKCIDLAKALGAPTVIVVPTYVGKLSQETEGEWDNAVSSIKEAGQYAETQNITLVIEAINRYETYLVTNLDLAKQFVEEVYSDNVKIMADLFHMSIEERNLTESLANISEYLVHIHIADNTREAAGMGHIDFKPVISFLKSMNYHGYITMEFLPSVSNPYTVSELHGEKRVFDESTQQSIRHIKEIIGNL